MEGDPLIKTAVENISINFISKLLEYLKKCTTFASLFQQEEEKLFSSSVG